MPYVIRPPIRKLRMSMTLGAVALATAVFPSMASADCLDEPISPIFSVYGDGENYSMVPGGDFAFKNPAWGLLKAKYEGGASALKSDKAPHMSRSDKSDSLKLDEHGLVTSPNVCVSVRHPTFRFFARKKGGDIGNLDVHLLWTGADGIQRETLVGSLNGADFKEWGIGPVLPLARALPIQGSETAQVQVVFDFNSEQYGADQESKGDWLVDEVYVDPYRR